MSHDAYGQFRREVRSTDGACMACAGQHQRNPLSEGEALQPQPTPTSARCRKEVLPGQRKVRYFRGAGVNVPQVLHAELLDHPQRGGVGRVRAGDHPLHTYLFEGVAHAWAASVAMPLPHALWVSSYQSSGSSMPPRRTNPQKPSKSALPRSLTPNRPIFSSESMRSLCAMKLLIVASETSSSSHR